MSSLRERTINSMLWNTIDRTGTLTLLFLSNLVLARLLMPKDFGCIAMLQVFLAIADILVHGGFGTALIQKKEVDSVDLSSVFYVNLAVSIILYLGLYFAAPSIARFYNIPLLSSVLRIQALVLIINSFSVVQLSVLKRALRFKEIAKRDLLSSFIGLLIGVLCAIFGCGVWSLVVNLLVTNSVGIVLLWRVSGWRPSFEFSFTSVKQLFNFGGLMMLASLLSTIFSNLQSLIIGRFFTASELGYVNQANKLQSVPSGAISSIVTQVSFPVFSQVQDNDEKLKYGLRKNVMAIQFINLPLMVLLIVIAEPLILFLYGQRWAISIPYFQILCLSQLIGAVVSVNLSVVSAKGKGNFFLYTQIIKCALAIALISVSVRHGIYALLFSLALIPYIEFAIGSIINKRLINYGCFAQVHDMLPTFLVSLFSGFAAYLLRWVLPVNMYVLMVLQIIVYILIYVGLTRLFRFEALMVYLEIIRTKAHR